MPDAFFLNFRKYGLIISDMREVFLVRPMNFLFL